MSACTFCGRQNESGAQFCTDCGKPLTQAAAARAAVAAAAAGAGVSRTSVLPPPASTAAEGHTCPVCGSAIDPSILGRFTPDRHSDQRLTLVLLAEAGVEVQRFERKQTSTSIGRVDGDITFRNADRKSVV